MPVGVVLIQVIKLSDLRICRRMWSVGSQSQEAAVPISVLQKLWSNRMITVASPEY